jgi:hypothetical protein
MAAKVKPASCIGETLSALEANGLLELAVKVPEAEVPAEALGAATEVDVAAGAIILIGTVVLVLVSLDMKMTCKENEFQFYVLLNTNASSPPPHTQKLTL